MLNKVKESPIYKTIENLKGYILILIGNLFLTFGFFLYKHFTSTRNFPPIVLIAYRGAFLSIYSMIYICAYFKHILKFDIKLIKSLIFRASLNGMGMLLVVNALKNLRVSTCELILRTGNLMSVFLSYFLINEKITVYDIYGLIVTFLGMIFILKPTFFFGIITEGEDLMIGVIYATLCAFMVAYGMIITKKLLESFHEIYAIILMGVMGSLVGIIGSQILEIDVSVNIKDFFSLALTTSIEFTGVLLSTKALNYEPIVKLAPFTNSRILYSVVLVYILHGTVDFYDLIGVSMIVSTYVYISLQKIKLINQNKVNVNVFKS